MTDQGEKKDKKESRETELVPFYTDQELIDRRGYQEEGVEVRLFLEGKGSGKLPPRAGDCGGLIEPKIL